MEEEKMKKFDELKRRNPRSEKTKKKISETLKRKYKDENISCGFKKGYTSWNKGLTKETDKIMKGISKKNKKNPINYWLGKERKDLWKKGPSRSRGAYHARKIMGQYLGRKLKGKESVHHINYNFMDNRIKNLKLFKNNSEHMKFHAKIDPRWERKYWGANHGKDIKNG